MDGMKERLHSKKERIPFLWSQSGLEKRKLWQLSVELLLARKNSKTFYTGFNY